MRNIFTLICHPVFPFKAPSRSLLVVPLKAGLIQKNVVIATAGLNTLVGGDKRASGVATMLSFSGLKIASRIWKERIIEGSSKNEER